MFLLFGTAGVGLLIISIVRLLLAWRTNYTVAKATGLPCIVIPMLPHAVSTKLFSPLLFPLLKKLPRSWTDAWLPHLEANSLWYDGYSVFQQVEFDTYLLVAPGGNILVTCSPDAISQIIHRREDFPRPVDLFRAIGVWGPNLATSEGAEWRRHRKIVARAFGDQNNREVWQETLYQTPQMMERWTAAEGERDRIHVPFVADLMQMSMHIISKAGFGHRMSWEPPRPVRAGRGSASTGAPEDKFGMSYTEAGRGLAHNILLVVGLPDLLLRYSPFAHLRKVRQYNLAFRAYVSEIIDQGRARGSSGEVGNDILHSLLRNADDENATEKDEPGLSDQEVLADAFIFMQAGHETTATTMQLSLIYLALNIDAQKELQQELDQVVGDRAPATWSYDDDLPRLLDGMLGTVMMEELRLAPPVPAVAKLTAGPLPITIDGLHMTIPGDTLVALNALAAHRNPKYWPHGAPADPSDPWHAKSNLDNDLEEFKPERWLLSSPQEASGDASRRKRNLLQPRKGAYFPFSEGPRSCLGRRFSQIEYAAVLAAIFQKYSMELDCRQYASDEEVAQMDRAERNQLREKVARSVRAAVNADMGLFITMLLKQGADYSIRLVARGKEQFY